MSDSERFTSEIEIKLDLLSFSNYLKLVGFLGRVEDEELHINGFFDTEDRVLSSDGWSLRVRAEEERGLVTLKGPVQEPGMVAVRPELESEIPRAVATHVIELKTDIMTLPAEPIGYVREKYGSLEMVRLAHFNNTRQTKDFRIGDYTYTFEIDKIEFSDGSVDYELEVELPDISRLEIVEDSLRKLFSSLAIPFEAQQQSKFARAMQHNRIF